MFMLIGNMCEFTLFAVIGDEAAYLPIHRYSMQMIFIKMPMNTEIVSDNVCIVRYLQLLLRQHFWFLWV